MPDVFEQLSAQHRSVEGLFGRFSTSGDEALAREIAEELRIHAEIEAVVLYPEIRRIVDGGDDLANRAQREDGELTALIDELEMAAQGDLGTVLDKLQRAVAENFDFEEHVLFAELNSAGVDTDELGRRFDAAMGESPTRTSGQVG